MKNAKELRKGEKDGKVFTKKVRKDIIWKKYNLFNSNNKECKVLLSNKTEEIILNEVKKELNWKEKIIVKIFNKTFNKISNLVRINTVNKIIE